MNIGGSPERRRSQIVRKLARNILGDCGSTLTSLKNNVHLDEGNSPITLQTIREVQRSLDDVTELIDSYTTDPSTTLKRLLDLED